jgi:hypothetical protein
MSFLFSCSHNHFLTSRNNISEELRTGADGYTDILKVTTDVWGKNLIYREKRK